MKSIICFLLSFLFAIPQGFYSPEDFPTKAHVITKVNRYYSDYRIGEHSEDFFFEYDSKARLIKADTMGYSEWQYLFDPSIVYSSIIKGTDSYEYDGDSRNPSRITRYDYDGIERFVIENEYDESGKKVREIYKASGDTITSVYSYDEDSDYDLVNISRDDGKRISDFSFKYFKNGTLHNWTMRQEYMDKLVIHRTVTLERDGDNLVWYASSLTPELTRYPGWTYMFYYKDNGDLDYIQYSHPYEGILYTLTFTWEDITVYDHA